MKNQNHSLVDSSKDTIQTGISIHISEQTVASMQGEDIDFEVSVTRKNNKSLFKKLVQGLTKLKDYFLVRALNLQNPSQSERFHVLTSDKG